MSDTKPDRVLYRRRSVQLMALVAAWSVVGFAPLWLALPFITGGWRTNRFGLAVSAIAAMVCGAGGVFLLRAAKPDWLTLRLDDLGFTLKRGDRSYRREWNDITGIQLTRRKNGRTTLPTILVTFQDQSTMYLDDIYTMPPEDLVRTMRQHCDRAENPWPSLPPIVEKRSRGHANWKLLLVLPALLVGMAVIALIKVLLVKGY